MTKETRLIGGISLLLMIVLIGLCFAMTERPPADEPVLLPPEPSDEVEQVVRQLRSTPATRYILRSDDGGVSVYRDGDETPLMSLDLSTAKLRAVDAETLAGGIEVDGDDALRRLIEDFTS